MDTPLHFLSIKELSQLIRARRLSPVEITRHMLDRVEQLEPSYRAFSCVMAQQAIARASQAEAELARGFDRGPLHGVPLAIKDLFFTDDAPTTAGMAVYKDWIPQFNATVVDRLYQAGAVMLGKLKMSEAAYSTHHPTIERPLNPWNTDYWTGSSSSGSAVATAAGMCFATLASDTGGSIRFPSACTNLSGIKPTRGRVSAYGTHAFCPSLDHIGPMARSADDAALLLQVIAGHDPQDRTSSAEPVPDYGSGSPRDMRSIRIGFDEGMMRDLEPDVAAALETAITVLRSLGAKIVACKLPDFAEAAGHWSTFCASETALVHQEAYERTPEAFGPEIAGLIERHKEITSTRLARAWLDRIRFSMEMDVLLGQVEMLVLPIMIVPTPTEEALSSFGTGEEELARMLRYTAPVDISGHPAIVLPCGLSKEGMPLSFQLVGPRMSEGTLIDTGRAFQSRSDWHLRHPAIG